jgi:hypothetical protein
LGKMVAQALACEPLHWSGILTSLAALQSLPHSFDAVRLRFDHKTAKTES